MRNDSMRDQERAYMLAEEQRETENNRAKARATHPYVFEGHLSPDAAEFYNYADELVDRQTSLDAMGLAFATRAFRLRPYAERYTVTNEQTGDVESWIKATDGSERWIEQQPDFFASNAPFHVIPRNGTSAGQTGFKTLKEALAEAKSRTAIADVWQQISRSKSKLIYSNAPPGDMIRDTLDAAARLPNPAVGNIFVGRRFAPGETVETVDVAAARDAHEAKAGRRASAFGEVEKEIRFTTSKVHDHTHHVDIPEAHFDRPLTRQYGTSRVDGHHHTVTVTKIDFERGGKIHTSKSPAGKGAHRHTIKLSKSTESKKRCDNPSALPLHNARLEGRENGLINSDASLDEALDDYAAKRPSDLDAFIERHVELAKQSVDPHTDLGDLLEEFEAPDAERLVHVYRQAFGEGFQTRLESALQNHFRP